MLLVQNIPSYLEKKIGTKVDGKKNEFEVSRYVSSKTNDDVKYS